MLYFTETEKAKVLINEYSKRQLLYLDTEVADYNTRKPKLSLIQILDDFTDVSGDSVCILDVLDNSEIAEIFIKEIMVNPAIEKVFHNSSYDLKLLGKTKAKNVSCTLEIAKSIPYYLLPVPNLQLRTLAEKLCYFPNIDKTEQSSDWGQRPLTESQLQYAKMDPIYLAHVHQRLLELTQLSSPDPEQEDVTALAQRYREIEQKWKLLDTEIDHIQNRLKAAMQAQELSETKYFQLSSYERTTKKIPFNQLARIAEIHGIDLEFPVTLTQNLQKDLGELVAELPVEEEKTTIWRLNPKEQEDEEDDGIPF
ncbi:ribonuclease D [Coleofasciculus sp. FACHB-SPT9]|uniref:ribonuclease D n=1 Tax=Cyanophyceae TaxID=3028117 RepID=UPI001689CD4C|nr:ribonuclease D [Coleofasciculus sp. FACHB-SPT9]MBD1891728.1 ribonuclease D [Coleofasciculus sp. FACHB-SPT9]